MKAPGLRLRHGEQPSLYGHLQVDVGLLVCFFLQCVLDLRRWLGQVCADVLHIFPGHGFVV